MPFTDVASVVVMLRWAPAEKEKYEGEMPGYIAAAEALVTAEVGDPGKVPPEVLKYATTALVVHMWSASSQRAQSFPEEMGNVLPGFVMPNLVAQALAPWRKIGGIG